MSKIIITIALLILGNTLFGQIDTLYFNGLINEVRILFSKEIDSAHVYLNKAVDYAEEKNYTYGQIQAGYYESLFLSRNNEHQQAIQLAKKHLKQCKTKDHNKLKINLLRFIGIRYKDIGNSATAHEFYDKALTLANQTNDTVSISNILYSKASLYEIDNNLPKALQIFINVLEYDRLSGNKRNVAGTLASMALLQRKLGKYGKAIDLINESISIDSTENKIYNLGIGYSTKGSIFKEMQKYQTSFDFYKRAYLLSLEAKSPNLLRSTATNLGSLSNELKQYKQALKFLAEAEEYVKNDIQKSMILNQMAYSYHKLDQNIKAKTYFERAIKISQPGEEAGSKESKALIGAEIYKRIGDYRQAFKYLEDAYVLADTINTVEEKELASNIEAKYELRIKNANIKSLNKDKLIQEEQLRTSKWQLLFIGLFSALLFGFFFYQLKKKSEYALINQKLESQNKHIQTLNQEIAHRVKNQVALTANLIANQMTIAESIGAKDLIKDIKNKVDAIATVNTQLQHDEDLTNVNINRVISEILENNIYSLSDRDVQSQVSEKEIMVNAQKASILSLIINELSTNSLKHAFHESKAPSITIDTKQSDNHMIISYQDNGTNTIDDQKTTNHQGSKLINGLVSQLGGKITYLPSPSFSAQLSIPNYEH